MTEGIGHYGWAILQTGILLGLCIALYNGAKWYFVKKRRQLPIKAHLNRLKNILIAVFTIITLLIWTPKIWPIFLVILFLLAIIAVTQKYSLQNLVGGVMIRWRQLFQEGDIVQISHHLGEVKTIGPFYFTLKEMDLNRKARISGQIVKIPNGLVSKNPLINYSVRKIHKHHLHYIFDKDTPLEHLKEVLEGVHPYVVKSLKSNKVDNHDIQEVKVTYAYAVKQSIPVGIKATITIHSNIRLSNVIEQAVEKYIIELSQGDNAIKLSF